MRRGKALSLWKVFVLIFVGLLSITGITALVLYFMGEFDEKHIEPEDMFFVETLNNGDGYYDSVLGRYEVSSNFSMTISTSTEDVTETKVTLSLKNGESVGNDYITDGKIKVPKVVELNKSFEVVLQQEYNSAILEDWVVGGVSTLTAKSENKLLLAKTVQIDVDVPVKDIDIKISGSQQTNGVQEIVVGSTFTIDTIFTPTNSQHLFSDSARNKEIFYANTSSYISYDWENEKFVANTRSGNATDTITVYTFLNSYYQKQIMDKFKDITDRELLTSSVLREFERLQKEEQKNVFVSKTINVKVLDIDVDSVSIDSENKSFDIYLDKYYILSANSNNGNVNLGISIKDSKGGSLGSLMGNVGIKVSKDATDFLIEGQEVMKVETSGADIVITKETYNETTNYAEAKAGVEYYILPYTTPKDYNDYYWQISSNKGTANEIELKINFFYENEDGLWETFFNISGDKNLEKQIKIRAEEHDYEEDPAWITNDTILMTINYDENGNAKPVSRDLSKDLNEINSDNIYKTVKYFIFIDGSDDAVKIDNLQNVFSVKAGVEYQIEIAGATTPKNGTYKLYEVNEEFVLTATKSFAGKVKVVATTVRTYANNKVVKDGDKYQIIKTSRAKDILVESTLSMTNMTPTFSFEDRNDIVEKDNKYYISAINRNESGSQKTMINLNFTLKSDDKETDEKKVLNAFSTKDLKIVCLDANGQEINDYVSLQGLTKTGTNGNDIEFEGELAIEEGFFSAGKTSVDKGTYVKLQLQYNNGKDVYKKTITLNNDENVDSFYIYYQQPVEMKATFDKEEDIKDEDGNLCKIKINISAATGITIKWGNHIFEGDTTEDVLNNLNELLTFELIDQYGKTIKNSSEIYNVRFVEESDEGETNKYLSFDSTLTKLKNFVSTQGDPKTTSLVIYVVDKEDKNVYNIVGDKGMLNKDDPMKSEKLSFEISSEGVTKVEYDKTDTVVSGEGKPDYVESNNLSTVRVEKYVTTDDNIDLNSLIKVYASDPETPTERLEFQLDKDYVSSLSVDNRTAIMKMLSFTNNINVVAEPETKDETKSIDEYIDLDGGIKSLKINNPFKEDTEIIFSVTDEAKVLFDITLVLLLKADISTTQSFNLYYDQYSQYLVQKENQIGVFANEKYDLSEYITLNSHLGRSYSWAEMFNGKDDKVLESSKEGLFESTTCKLKREGEGDEQKIYLLIDPIYKFESISFTLYYGARSFYACSTTITLYANPNILVKQKSKLVKLEDIGTKGAKLTDNYGFYVLTEAVDSNFKEGAISSDDLKGFAFENFEQNKYLTISNDSFSYGFEKDKTLSLKLGEKIEQSFKMTKGSENSKTTVVAVLMTEDETIVLCEESETLSILLQIGYDTDASQVLGAGTAVQYQNEIYLLLNSSVEYNTNNEFEIVSKSATGEIYSDSGTILKTRDPNSFVSLTGNSFAVTKTLYDGQGNALQINLSLKVIVSKVGEKFVYYSKNLPEEVNEMEYNTYIDDNGVKLSDLSEIIGDYQKLEQNNIAQSLKAGEEYIIIHNTKNALTKEELEKGDVYGFYYDGTSTQINIAGPSASYSLSVMTEAKGYIDGLARIDQIEGKLIINNLESSYTDAYIVLKFEIKKIGGNVSFVWYYRIKVEPNFSVGKVTYPYSDEVGEYLDVYSNYYDEDKNEYEIDLEEPFTRQISKYEGGKRFADISWKDGASKTTTPQYTIKSATVDGLQISNYGDYFTYSFNNGILTISLKNNATKLSVMVEKSLCVDGIKMIGSEMQYNLIFNQGDVYIPTVKMVVSGTSKTLTHKNYRYDATVTAGGKDVEFNTSIKISSNGTESKVSNYNAYISGTSADALQYKKVAKSGAKYYNQLENGQYEEVGTLEGDFVFGDWSVNKAELSDSYVKLENVIGNGTTYYVDKANIYYTQAYLDSNKTLHLKTQSTIKEDSFFEIGFYTDERVAFRIDLTVTSYFEWTINEETEFKGGEKYSYEGSDNAIFRKISSKNDTEIEGLSIELIDSSQADLVSKTDGLSGSIEFAHLTEDTTFKFKATITDTKGSYSFNFDLLVSKSFDVSETRRVDDTEGRYGGLEFEVTIDDLVRLASNKFPKLDEGNTEYKFKDGTDSKSITPDNVATKTTVQDSYTMACLFKGKEIFNFEITYRYTTNPSVSVESNYPNPDGKTELNKEYVSTSSNKKSETFEKFFETKAYFGTKERITIQDLTEGIDKKEWTISISSISNAIVYVSGSVSKEIGVESSDKIVVSNTEDVSGISIQFAIVNTASSGLVTFDVTVNAVTTTYQVEIIFGDIITVSTNTPNYENNRETIYAEDLVNQEEKTLFSQARILNYAFSTEIETGTEYYLRYENESKEIEVLTISANTLGAIINQDLGKSYKGYDYKGTFASKEAAEDGTAERKYVDEQIYLSAPKLTERVVAYYYDGTQIVFNNNVELMYSNGGLEASGFILTDENYNKEVNLKFSLKVNDKTIETSGNYNLYLDIEFTVTGNADSSNSYTTVDIKAGETKRLLSYSEFGIKNARTGLLYDPDSMYASSGTITLEIYGFAGAPQVDASSNEALKKAAGEIHNNLINNETEGGIKYSTGLTPRVLGEGETINSIGSGDLRKSYITISGVINNKKSVDYAITAQGANNDGNHVMMRITYKVEIGGKFITKQHNILFKVVPNSTIKFKNSHDNSQIYNASSNEIIGNQTVASNQSSPYEIVFKNSDNVTFYLWNNNDSNLSDKTQSSVVLANMYGSSTNSANTFTYSYPAEGSPVGYNVGYKEEKTIDTSKTSTITVSVVNLGSKYFVIDVVNDFGFKMRFYYQATASINPQIASASDSYTEGDTVAFGVMYNSMVPATNSEGYALYSPFKIVEYKDKTKKSVVANTIKVELDEGIKIISAKVEIVLNGDITIDKETIKEGTTIYIDTESISEDGFNFIKGDWTVEGGKVSVNIATDSKVLVGQTCTFMLKVGLDGGDGETIKTYTATYMYGEQDGKGGDLTLTQQHTVSNALVSPNFSTESGVAKPEEIVLTGMSAYGYATSLVAVDKNALNISNFQDVKVSQIELYLGEKSLVSTTKTEGVPLVTDPAISFANSGIDISQGVAYTDEKMGFVIPMIDGFYFGTSNKLNNVKMRITLKKGEDVCVLTKNITLKRAVSSEGLFTSTTIADNNKIAVKSDKTVYNDTLEVVLKQGESIKLQLSNVENDFTNAKTVELSNNKPYTITEYVGISRNITGLTTNLKPSNTVYIKMEKEGDPVLNYNGANVSSSSFNIATYSNITLNIENVDELDSSNQKTETLYFLFKENKTVYQHVETFTVVPQQKSAEYGDNYFMVTDFMKASNGTNSYYILTLGVWAQSINLIDYSGANSGNVLTIDNAYKYYFEINTSDGERAGSAFIDENGMITTTEDFNILSHTISVNVYMKVSGQDGNFEVANQKLLLGTFTLYLDSSKEVENVITISNNPCLVDNNIISLPVGYSLYYYIGEKKASDITDGSLTENRVFAVEVGEEFEFAKLYNELTATGSNKTYHLVGYKKDGSDYTAVNFDNVDSWTFDTAGTYEITFVLNQKCSYKKYTSTIIAYETSTKEENNILLEKNTAHTLDGNYTWYEIGESGQVTAQTEYKETNAGVYTKKYIAKKGNSTKIVTNNYYVYDEVEKREIVTASEFAYSLKNLVGTLEENQTVEFYKVVSGEFVKCTTDSAVSDETTATYVACIKQKESGKWTVTGVKYFEVTYRIVSQTITELTTYIKLGENLQNTAEAEIKDLLKVEGSEDITIKTIESSNILTDNESKAEKNVETKMYFVSYSGRNYRFKVTFYAYKSTQEIEYSTNANNTFSLSTMNSEVIEQVSADIDADVSYYKISDYSLTQVSTISLENDCDQQFYVKVGDMYYLITFNFKIINI